MNIQKPSRPPEKNKPQPLKKNEARNPFWGKKMGGGG